MANRTIGKLLYVNIVFLDPLASGGKLIGWGLPGCVKDLIAGPDEPLGRAMAFQAPLHVQSFRLPKEGHPVDAAMASITADSLAHVDAVIEVDKVGQVIDSSPCDWLPRAKALAYRFQNRAIGPDLGVAIHAYLSSRHTGVGGLLYRGVTIATVDADATDVMLVAERHRLLNRDVDVGCVG
jgi:hypothetical protein